MRQIQKREGLTIVELLVVMAIVGILLAMLLPATRTVGEAARRTQCLNNLRQIALATLNHESAHQVIPAGTGLAGFAEIGSGSRLGGFVAILPFLEQNQLYEQITRPVTIEGVEYRACPPLYGSMVPHWKTPLPCFICPSVRVEEGRHAPAHYGMCIGDRARSVASPNSLRGGFNGSKRIHLDEITDGISNTIAFAEICTPGNSSGKNQYAANQPSSILDDPSKCFELTDGETDWKFKAKVQLGPISRGGHWADGRAGVALFNTILQPNSPSIAVNGSVGVDGIYSASGPHPGAVNIALFDGSTQRISVDVDAGDATAATRTEEEMAARAATPYGIWGALGTINDGRAFEDSPF